MTRINCGIPPTELHNKHLLAEHREIKRIPNIIKSGKFNMLKQPENFTLGTGHVKFFYDKLLYLKKRYILLYEECVRRGFNVTDFSPSFDGIPDEYMKDYTPTEQDKCIVRCRISERLKIMNTK